MQLVVPMSGLGSRFKAAGYKDVKPLIKVHERHIIKWVVKMFPNVDDILFIVRDEHIATDNIAQILNTVSPTANIASIPGSRKGPVYAVAQAYDKIKPNEPIIVSYCDYFMHWDFDKFTKDVASRDCDGAIPCYTGFHPHLLPKKNLYASCKVDENSNLIEIREKFSWTDDKTLTLHSPGTYYFKSGTILQHYFDKMLSHGPTINDEYYVSLVYNHMVNDSKTVYVPSTIKHFCQWGTPEDLREYEFWTDKLNN